MRVNFIDFIRAFFPLQLIVAHFKHNLIGLFTWVFFFLIITDNFGARFGLPILFFSPEYMGNVSYVSFALLGFGFGGLSMAFNSYSYSKFGKRFPFLTFVKRPFIKFCQNNALIPLLFLFLYLYKMMTYQSHEELASTIEILFYGLSFIGGVTLFVSLSLAYFFPISKRFKILNLVTDEDVDYDFATDERKKSTGRWYSRIFSKADFRYFYFGRKFKLLLESAN